MSSERESDSEPTSIGDLEVRSLVKVVSGDGFPESMDRLSLDACGGTEITVVRTAGLLLLLLPLLPGVWLMEWRCGNARDKGGVAGGAVTEWWDR
jgi:hypothetical protein